ncbi:DNA methyltransferase [Streptococcus hyovaginalis]|uniref:class I SAM-dependent DNA methyltransferase n=1 Tax=Streptococcus hyovaginalis TaxID=149015 RepID=UPI002A817572|nr:DNA methyltransferase [Streptococcus hyovaginalis]MDY4510550.1 DNA methyltransferase [Streptococcus hyovaginalis]
MAIPLTITEIEDKVQYLVNHPNLEIFFYDFLSLYQFPKATLTRLRKEKGNHIKNKVLFEVVKGERSVVAEVASLEASLKGKKSIPRYLIVTDFEHFAAKDTKTFDTLQIPFKDLPTYADFFLAWNGVEKVDYAKENPADIKAAERFTRLYDELKKINYFDDRSQEEKEFNLFLIRLLFLLFAEDTEIMKKGIFTNAIKTRSREDGSDLNLLFNQIFASLDIANRLSQESWLQEFPYVNGKLFTDASTNLVFDKKTRKLILEAGELLNWNEINPDILGAMIQTVASSEHRSSSGMHYTSVENIMKVIKPLFLDELTANYQTIVDKINENEDKDTTERTKRENRTAYQKELTTLHKRLSNIKFFDPACGSGNFLIITYKELRRLEIQILKTLRHLRNDHSINIFEVSKISLHQFYGIELDDFAHEVARLSLWIAEYQMNLEALNEINMQSAFLPLRDAGNITQGNALRLDWDRVVPHTPTDEIYLIGNPPYIGAKLQNKEQKEDLRLTIGEQFKYKLMDYIAGWFFKGIDFINTANAKLAFVTTNSIFQGEQVAYIWKPLLEKCEIEFAYTSFKWGNSAANNAGVTVAIVGLANKINTSPMKYIFDENLVCQTVSHINPYLASGEDIIVESRNKVLSNIPKMCFGNMPNDGGGLIFSSQEYFQVINDYPELIRFLKKFIGGTEFINGNHRYALWLNQDQYLALSENPVIRSRVELTKLHRLNSKSESAQKLAKRPWSFRDTNETDSHSILVPRVSSESRDYVPMGFVGDDTIISDSAMAVYNAPVYLLGLLMSRLHMTWLRAIGGKLKTDYRYSAGLVYNTFPVPELSTKRKNQIEEQVFEILDLREELGGTLAELYHRDTMPQALREAHQVLDGIVERAYKETPFISDEERLSHLLKRYKEMKEQS